MEASLSKRYELVSCLPQKSIGMRSLKSYQIDGFTDRLLVATTLSMASSISAGS